MVNLAAHAHSIGRGGSEPAIRAWQTDLDRSADGRRFTSHLDRDRTLEACGSGRDALSSLLNEIGGWHGVTSPADALIHLAWLVGHGPPERLPPAFRDRWRDLLVQGAEVVPTPSGDATTVISLAAISEFLTIDRQVDRDAMVVGDGTSDAANRDDLWKWGAKFLLDDTLRLTVLDPRKTIRGQRPIVFAAPAEDLRLDDPVHDSSVTHPTGRKSAAARAWEVRGVRRSTDAPLDACRLHFPLDGEGRVPSCLDAYTSEHFVPAPAGADWGRTTDLAIPGAEGVRECVVAQFAWNRVTRWEVLAG